MNVRKVKIRFAPGRYAGPDEFVSQNSDPKQNAHFSGLTFINFLKRGTSNIKTSLDQLLLWLEFRTYFWKSHHKENKKENPENLPGHVTQTKIITPWLLHVLSILESQKYTSIFPIPNNTLSK